MSCARWEGDGESSDMAVMELGIASGFSPSQDAIEKVTHIHKNMALISLTLIVREGTEND